MLQAVIAKLSLENILVFLSCFAQPSSYNSYVSQGDLQSHKTLEASVTEEQRAWTQQVSCSVSN